MREVLIKAKGSPISVGVFIQVTDRPFERVYAAIDPGPDGRAALDLGVRVALRDRYGLPDLPKPDPQMLQIAEKIVEQQSGEFDPSEFRDRYEEALRALID